MNDTVCYSKLIEIKKLTFSQVDKLSNIFYNYGYKKVSAGKGIGAISLCYFPRNAILFLDTTGTVFEYIEICFECNRTKESSSKVSLGEMCSQKMKLVKDFFKVSGIEYGITKGLMGGD